MVLKNPQKRKLTPMIRVAEGNSRQKLERARQRALDLIATELARLKIEHLRGNALLS